jgi:hypothetical protein
MAFNPDHLPTMSQLESDWLALPADMNRRSSILGEPPHHYLDPSTIFGLTRVSGHPHDRREIEAAADWGDEAARILQLMKIREDADEPGAQAVPGGDTPSDRANVVEDINRTLKAKELARISLAGMEEVSGTVF